MSGEVSVLNSSVSTLQQFQRTSDHAWTGTGQTSIQNPFMIKSLLHKISYEEVWLYLFGFGFLFCIAMAV